VKTTTTTRGKYSVAQFEEALQQMAHDLPKFTRVKTENWDIKFSYNDDGSARKVYVTFTQKTGKVKCGTYGCKKEFSSVEDWEKHAEAEHEGYTWFWEETVGWGFNAEQKLYLNSDDVTKITYNGDLEEITEWIEMLMSKANVTPVPRFSLKDYPGSKA
jgi:hypothetical protein